MVEPIERHATFIVRVIPSDDGGLTGTVERVRTGEKRRFYDSEELHALIARMAAEPASAEDERSD
jgi:hypothetical protein